MAVEWIQIAHTLPDDPKVIRMAKRLGVTPQHLLGCLVKVWIKGDQLAENRLPPCAEEGGEKGGENIPPDEGFLGAYDFDLIDQVANQPGFAEVLMNEGWLTLYPDGVAFPEWDVFHSTSAKIRALERKKKQQQKKTREKVPSKRADMGGKTFPQNSDEKGGLEMRSEKGIKNTPHKPPEGGQEQRGKLSKEISSKPGKGKTPKPSPGLSVDRKLDALKPSPEELRQMVELWEIYPRNAARGNALPPMLKAMREVGFEALRSKVRQFRQSVTGPDVTEPDVIPYAASWFNGRRWEDDPAEWLRIGRDLKRSQNPANARKNDEPNANPIVDFTTPPSAPGAGGCAGESPENPEGENAGSDS